MFNQSPYQDMGILIRSSSSCTTTTSGSQITISSFVFSLSAFCFMTTNSQISLRACPFPVVPSLYRENNSQAKICRYLLGTLRNPPRTPMQGKGDTIGLMLSYFNVQRYPKAEEKAVLALTSEQKELASWSRPSVAKEGDSRVDDTAFEWECGNKP